MLHKSQDLVVIFFVQSQLFMDQMYGTSYFENIVITLKKPLIGK